MPTRHCETQSIISNCTVNSFSSTQLCACPWNHTALAPGLHVAGQPFSQANNTPDQKCRSESLKYLPDMLYFIVWLRSTYHVYYITIIHVDSLTTSRAFMIIVFINSRHLAYVLINALQGECVARRGLGRSSDRLLHEWKAFR